jgi:limonene-1,2-epoxide hydrolase
MKKHPLVIIIALFALAIGCTSASKNTAKNIALVESYIKAVEQLDFNAMEDALAENYLGLGPSKNDSIGKEAAVESWKLNVANLYESITYNRSQTAAVIITEGENAGEWVSNWAELEIVYKTDTRKATIWANSMYKIENDKIVKSYTFYNEADVLEQLGYVMINLNDL